MGIKHYHCPENCEKPQPWEMDGKWYCGRCWFKDHVLTECFLCTPETCPEDFKENEE